MPCVQHSTSLSSTVAPSARNSRRGVPRSDPDSYTAPPHALCHLPPPAPPSQPDLLRSLSISISPTQTSLLPARCTERLPRTKSPRSAAGDPWSPPGEHEPPQVPRHSRPVPARPQLPPAVCGPARSRPAAAPPAGPRCLPGRCMSTGEPGGAPRPGPPRGEWGQWPGLSQAPTAAGGRRARSRGAAGGQRRGDGSRVGVPGAVRLRAALRAEGAVGCSAVPGAGEWRGEGAGTGLRCPRSRERLRAAGRSHRAAAAAKSVFTTLWLHGRCEPRPERSPAVSRYQGVFPSEPPPWVSLGAPGSCCCSRAEAAGAGRHRVGTAGALEEPGAVETYPTLGVVERAPPVGVGGAGCWGGISSTPAARRGTPEAPGRVPESSRMARVWDANQLVLAWLPPASQVPRDRDRDTAPRVPPLGCSTWAASGARGWRHLLGCSGWSDSRQGL